MGFRTDQVSGAESSTVVAAREPLQLPRAVSYPGRKVKKERAAKLFNKKTPISTYIPGGFLPQQRIAPDTSTSGHVVQSSQ
ncbi:hypothetical protein WJX77_006670 [Trebouxia sp. C0004]